VKSDKEKKGKREKERCRNCEGNDGERRWK